MNELKNPQTRLISYAALSIVAIIILINALKKDIDYSSLVDWVNSGLLYGTLSTIGFPIQACRAYKELKKINEEAVE